MSRAAVVPPSLRSLAGQFTNTLQYQRWSWAYSARATRQGEIPEAAQVRALEQIRKTMSWDGSSSRPAPLLSLQGDRWVSIGPTPILNSVTGTFGNTRGAVTGRIAAVAVDPTNLNHWFIGAAQGGVWETWDAGITWTPRTDNQASLATGSIALAPSNPKIIYVGTGEGVSSADAYAGVGLLKSTDGGTNWHLLGASAFGRSSFRDLKVSPTDPNVLLAATVRGIAGVSFGMLPAAPPVGIYKSTDGGTNWSLTLDAKIRLLGGAWSLQCHPSDFNRQYASAGSVFGNPTINGVFRSFDAGQTWQLISAPWNNLTNRVERVQLAPAPSNPNVLYVSIQDAFGNPDGNPGALLGIWRTDNAWAANPTWTQLPNPSGTSSRFWYNHDLLVDPVNPNVLFLGEVNLWKYNGTTWSEITGSMHVDQQRLAWAGNELIAANDGGLWSSADAGNSWNNLNTNLALTQFYQGSLHPANPNFALGGCQDNGAVLWNGALAWSFLLEGDGGYCAFSQSRPDTDWAVSTQLLQVSRTRDGGQSFTDATAGIDKWNALFIAPFKQCPANENIFIAATDNLWKTTNFFSATPPSWVANGPELSENITALAFAPSDTNGLTYAFGTLSSGLVNITTNGGATWANLMTFGRYVSGLAFSPTNPSTLYVTLSSFDHPDFPPAGHVFKTTNALAASPSFANVSPPVDIPHNAIALDPFNPLNVYVGTDIGIWRSTNGAASWSHMGPEVGMPNVAVFDFEVSAAGRLVAFTHGRGAFALVTPPFLSAGPRVGGAFSLSFATLPGVDYLVQYKNTLSDPTWHALRTVPGNGSVETITDTNSLASQRFYRGLPAN